MRMTKPEQNLQDDDDGVPDFPPRIFGRYTPEPPCGWVLRRPPRADWRDRRMLGWRPSVPAIARILLGPRWPALGPEFPQLFVQAYDAFIG
jgi:hypothetical protein